MKSITLNGLKNVLERMYHIHEICGPAGAHALFACKHDEIQLDLSLMRYVVTPSSDREEGMIDDFDVFVYVDYSCENTVTPTSEVTMRALRTFFGKSDELMKWGPLTSDFRCKKYGHNVVPTIYKDLLFMQNMTICDCGVPYFDPSSIPLCLTCRLVADDDDIIQHKCMICLGDSAQMHMRKLLCCGNYMHVQCVQQYLASADSTSVVSCPLCRKTLFYT